MAMIPLRTMNQQLKVSKVPPTCAPNKHEYTGDYP